MKIAIVQLLPPGEPLGPGMLGQPHPPEMDGVDAAIAIDFATGKGEVLWGNPHGIEVVVEKVAGA